MFSVIEVIFQRELEEEKLGYVLQVSVSPFFLPSVQYFHRYVQIELKFFYSLYKHEYCESVIQ